MTSERETIKASSKHNEGLTESCWASVSVRPSGVIVPILIICDLLTVWICLGLGVGLRLALAPFFEVQIGRAQYEGLFFASLIVPFVHVLNGVYPGFGLTGVERTRLYFVGTFLAFAVMIGLEYIVLRESWSRGVLLLSWGFSVVAAPMGAEVVRRLLAKAGLWGAPVVILGAAKTGEEVARRLKEQGNLGLRPIAFLDDDPQKHGQTIEGLRVLGGLDMASELSKRRIRHALLAMPGAPRDRLTRIVERSPFRYTLVILDLFGFASLWVSGRDLGGVLGFEVKKNLLFRRNRLLKRATDYLLGVPLFLAGLPLMAFFALWIKRVSPGPALYTQEREGKDGKVIKILKLRTMYPDSEKRLEEYLDSNQEARRDWERYYKLKDDPRILPKVGHILRKTSLDELPQLWNVLRGDMSLVGPRPFPFYHLDAFSEEFRTLRRSVLPGLTGLWQVSARSEGDLAVQEQMDSYYIRNWSLWLDLYILAKTVSVVLKGKGAY